MRVLNNKVCKQQAKAFAPASVGNIGVGFDILGFSFDKIGDNVSVSTVPSSNKLSESSTQQVVVEEIRGCYQGIPYEVEKNTAAFSVLKMLEDLGIQDTIYLQIDKGIPPGSGLGSSAASAVAAVVALNSLLAKPLPTKALFDYALYGESLSCGSFHGDNVGPSLLGGLVLTVLNHCNKLIELPCPQGLYYVVVYPDLIVTTKKSRSVLKESICLKAYVKQSGYLAQFVAGLFMQNKELIKDSLKDTMIEPQRSKFIPGFEAIKNTVISSGALGCSISGAGPSVFAWTDTIAKAQKISVMIQNIFAKYNTKSKAFIGDICKKGSYLI